MTDFPLLLRSTPLPLRQKKKKEKKKDRNKEGLAINEGL